MLEECRFSGVGTDVEKARGTMRRLLLGFSMLVALAALAIAASPPAHAAIGVRETPDKTWNTNGTVFDTELSDDGSTLYIGGRFGSVRENPPGVAGRSFAVSNVAAIDVATGEAISGWNPKVTGGTSPVVRALEVEGDKVFIGGNFTTVGGQPRQNLAAVDATDASVEPFAPNVTETTGSTPFVYALLADGSRLYAGGTFNNVDGKRRAKLAAFNLPAGTLDLGWKPMVSGGSAYNGSTNPHVRELEFD